MIRAITLGLIATGTFVLFYFGLFEEKRSDAKEIFTTDEIVWYGLDFTEAHFIGTFDQGAGLSLVSGEELRSTWIPAWNNLFVAEPYNFNLRRTFRKRKVYYDINSVNELNEKIKPDELMSFNETKIEKETIQEMVKRYTGKEKKDGVGLVFIIENFNKNSKTAGMHVTFFDIATKKVLMTEFMSGNPVGFGLRNYWAGAIKEVLNWIDFYEYNKWKNKYYNKPSDKEDVLSGLPVEAKQ
jgi:hypothetical protein